MSEQQIGERIDAAGLTLDLDDDDLVSDYMVIAKVVRSDGQPTVAIGNSDGMDWLTQLGILAAANQIINTPSIDQEDE